MTNVWISATINSRIIQIKRELSGSRISVISNIEASSRRAFLYQRLQIEQFVNISPCYIDVFSEIGPFRHHYQWQISSQPISKRFQRQHKRQLRQKIIVSILYIYGVLFILCLLFIILHKSNKAIVDLVESWQKDFQSNQSFSQQHLRFKDPK